MSANASFQMVNEQGWRRGFANLLRRENNAWWRTRRWWISILIWMVLVNGIVFASLWGDTGDGAARTTPDQLVLNTMAVLPSVLGLFGAIGAAITMQGLIIDEKKSGTAAWVMSKPASRAAFVISKLVANVVAMLVVVVAVQGTIAYVLLSIRGGTPAALGPFLVSLALIALNLLFYLTLTLMLGTLFSERGPVIAIPIAVLFSSQFLVGILGDLSLLMPWYLLMGPSLATQAIMGQPLATTVPIVATMVWIVVFVGIAIWRFQREEF
jgi:ABC-2 type transport system permease protein